MTRIINLFFCCAVLLANLHCTSGNNSSAITGEGEIVSQEITIEELRGVLLAFKGDVILTQGSPQQIILEGQQNILDNIKREVRNGVWEIDYKNNVKGVTNVTVRITLAKLDEAGISGSGSMKSANRFTGIDKLALNSSGSGVLMMDLEANSTDLVLSGSGKVNLSGISKMLSISASGSGDIDAGQLQTEDCKVSINGSGRVNVNASTSLDAHINGSGNIQYSGNASVNTKINGSGNVSKI